MLHYWSYWALIVDNDQVIQEYGTEGLPHAKRKKAKSLDLDAYAMTY